MGYVHSARRALRLLTVVATLSAVIVVGDGSPSDAVSRRPQRTPSFNGTVFAVAYRGDTVCVGGAFTTASGGGRTVPRQRLAAFSARTGALLSWSPAVNGTVKALTVSRNAVYIAGDFGTVAGRRRDSVARLDARSGAVWSLAHSVTGEAAALAVAGGRLYVGGRFSAVDGARRGNLAAFALSNGALDRRWTPRADDRVDALAAAGSRVYLGGSFHRVNGASGAIRFAAVSASNGALIRGFRPAAPAVVYALTVDRTGVYAATGGSGGRAIAYTAAGRVRWVHLFDGDLHGITTLGGITYVGGHFDRACRNRSTIAQRGCVGGALPRVKLAALDSRGSLTSWNPRANGVVGVRALASNRARNQVAVGGEFTRIGGVQRERYAAFSG